jgi:transposase
MASLDGFDSRADRRYRQRRASIGAAVLHGHSVATVMQRFDCTRGEARYWGKRAEEPSSHDGEIGGARHETFKPEVQAVVHALLWAEVRANPVRSVLQFARVLQQNGWNVSVQWVRRTFREWRFTSKKPNFRSVNKYSATNIQYYGCVLLAMPQLLRRARMFTGNWLGNSWFTLPLCHGRTSNFWMNLISTRGVSGSCPAPPPPFPSLRLILSSFVPHLMPCSACRVASNARDE